MADSSRIWFVQDMMDGLFTTELLDFFKCISRFDYLFRLIPGLFCTRQYMLSPPVALALPKLQCGRVYRYIQMEVDIRGYHGGMKISLCLYLVNRDRHMRRIGE